jgi:hypothetical protein
VDIELRPLRLAEIFDRIFQLYRARFKLFLGIAAVSTTVELAWNLTNMVTGHWLNKSPLALTARQAMTSFLLIVGWAFVFAAAALCLGATNRALAAIYDGKPTSIAQAFSELRPNWLRCIWVNTLTYVIAWGSVILVLIGTITAVVLAKRAATVGQANTLMAVYSATGLLLLVAAPLCMWLTLRYSLAVPACVQESLKTLQSLKRSVFLAKGTQGRILLLLLIVVAAQSMVGIVLMSPVFAVFVRSQGHASPAATAYLLVAGALTSALIKPIYCIGLTLFYLDARVRKEGFDLERMLDRSVRDVPPEGIATTIPTREPTF